MRYKELAREKLRGKWLSCMGIVFLYVFISYLVGFISEFSNYGVGMLLNLVLILVGVGYFVYFLNLVRGREKFSDLFIVFEDLSGGLSYILISILSGFIILLGVLFFLIPGIILSYSLKYVTLIKYDNPEMDIIEVLKTSNAMMKGRKKEAFLLDLSFIGWYLLAFLILIVLLVPMIIVGNISLESNPYILVLLSIFIGLFSSIIVIPVSVYHQTSIVELYENIREVYFGNINKDVDYVYMEETAEVDNDGFNYKEELSDNDIVADRDTDSNLY